jgi:site-specific recombinase XerC
VSARLESSGRYRSWMSYIRDFGRWLQATGASDACVLSDRWKSSFAAPRPYLRSNRQIELSFAAAAALKAQSPRQWQAVAFFTLMHSCGLRTGEARALQAGHVDLDAGHVDVVCSKGNRSRRLPLTGEVIEIPAAGDRASRAHFPASDVLRLRRRQPGQPVHGRNSVRPDLGPGGTSTAGRRPAAAALRLPAPFCLRLHRAMDEAGQGRDCDAALPVSLHGPRVIRQHLLHPHLARLHGRLRPDHPGQPAAAAGGGLRIRRDPATGAPDFFSFARDYMPRARALSPKAIEAYRISLECFLGYLAETEHTGREHVSFDHFDRQHLKAWLAWMTGQRHYTPGTVALRLSAVKAFLAYAAQQDITLVALSQAARALKTGSAPQARRLPHRTRDTGDPRRARGEHAEIPAEPDAAHPALRHRRAGTGDHRPDPAGPVPDRTRAPHPHRQGQQRHASCR